MLRITEKAQEYLNSSEEVRTFNSILVYDEEGYRNGKRMSLIQCLKSILGKREGELKVDEEGSLILDDGKREFALVNFHCGFDYDCSTYIELLNRQANYSLEFEFPLDDVYIASCSIREQISRSTKDGKTNNNIIKLINKEKRGRDNEKHLQEVETRTKKNNWIGEIKIDVTPYGGGKATSSGERIKANGSYLDERY